MSLDWRVARRDKEASQQAAELDAGIKDIKQQLNEQLRCLELRLELQLTMLGELQDFYRRRSEVEIEYSRGLDRVVKQVMSRHKGEKGKRELWPGFSTYTCWQTLLGITKRQSQDHAAFSDLYSTVMGARFTSLVDHLQRMHRKCREIAICRHQDLVKNLRELESCMKTYQQCHGEGLAAEEKLRNIEDQKNKLEELGSRSTLNRKFRSLQKRTEKKQAKYSKNKLKSLKARNEYLISLAASNASLAKHFTQDIPDLIDCMDFGYHTSLAQTVLLDVAAKEQLVKSHHGCLSLLNKCVGDLNQKQDKQRFIEIHQQTFAAPLPFNFQPHRSDAICQISAQQPMLDELLIRQRTLTGRLGELQTENDEVWKTLEMAEKSMLSFLGDKNGDVSSLFTNAERINHKPDAAKVKEDNQETEDFYLKKFGEYLNGTNIVCRLQAKHSSIQKALGADGESSKGLGRPPLLPPKPKTKMIQPSVELFGGSLESHWQAANNDIPEIIKSCVKAINLHGMHQQGVFRVSGSQQEINYFKASFQRGEDPLDETGQDINSVAGLLKLYMRELNPPLFPPVFFNELVKTEEKLTQTECINKVASLLEDLPRSSRVVMRYLFAFLSHLTEFSDENMMDARNIAVCFGPTLLPTPNQQDQVTFQGNVNELIENIIVHQDQLFPLDGGTYYERCIVDGDEQDQLENLSDDEETSDGGSEAEIQTVHAKAKYDYSGRSGRELSFQRGDLLQLISQVSIDWWHGRSKGITGLIPDKYITVLDRDSLSNEADSALIDKRRCSADWLTDLPPANLMTQSDIAATKASNDNFVFHPAKSGPVLDGTSSPQFRLLGRLDKELSLSSKSHSKSNPAVPSSGNVALRSEQFSGNGDADSVNLNSFSVADSSAKLQKRHAVLNLAAKRSSDSSSSDSYSLRGSSSTSSSSPVDEPDDPHLGDDDYESSTAEMQLDIDEALAQVMSGIQSLQKQREEVLNRHTPDLVLDLPSTYDSQLETTSVAGSSSRNSPSSEISPLMSSAEMFVSTRESTIKKGGHQQSEHHRPLSHPNSTLDRQRPVIPETSCLKGEVSLPGQSHILEDKIATSQFPSASPRRKPPAELPCDTVMPDEIAKAIETSKSSVAGKDSPENSLFKSNNQHGAFNPPSYMSVTQGPPMLRPLPSTKRTNEERPKPPLRLKPAHLKKQAKTPDQNNS